MRKIAVIGWALIALINATSCGWCLANGWRITSFEFALAGILSECVVLSFHDGGKP